MKGLHILSFLSRIFGKARIAREPLRPLWQRIVEIARDRHWYAECGIADTVAGRFDAVTLVLSLVLLRMEQDKALMEPSVRLTELFVEDMDGQLRQSGVGDIVVGKHVGKLMQALGGRLGAYRKALSQGGDALADALSRNVTLTQAARITQLATAVEQLARRIAGTSAEDLLAGRIA
ncbi:MAG: ubiquinol-cytochrome C chaperone family protein [Novosphingobium sp.]|nr:ubiquinol-cytochrome C chaperone family protein [Novosphingobium sp.]